MHREVTGVQIRDNLFSRTNMQHTRTVLKGMGGKQMRFRFIDVADFWYTAWVNVGKLIWVNWTFSDLAKTEQ